MMNLPRRIYYTGSDPQAMKAIEKADVMRDVVRILATVRASHISACREDKAEKLTHTITVANGVMHDIYRDARRILKDLCLYGDPTSGET